ncbi:MAG: hypothetical protein HQ559_09985 [Lentisphaerae bacterium]|nr:hypothetical protein [Lentisphaerota bacterium]
MQTSREIINGLLRKRPVERIGLSDALNPMEAKAGSDVVDFAKRYGDQLAFVGGKEGA